MQRISFSILLIITVTGTLSCRAAGQANDLQMKINQYMKAEVNAGHFMGSILVAKGDHIIMAKGYGKANVENDIQNTANTEFHIGSVTKQFTAMAILMLQNKGKLNVQDHICKYVPKCPDDWQPITIYNLLTHTSGIPDYLDSVSPETMTKRLTGTFTPTQLVAFFKNKPLDFKPGTKFSYSNSGYVLLGYIIGRVADESYGQFLQQHIFDPLGMEHSGYGNIDSTVKTRAQGYRPPSNGTYKKALKVDFASAIGDGGVYSTVRDLYTWDRALAANKLIPASLQKKMFVKQVPVKGNLSEISGADGAVYYGFGWFIKQEFGHKQYAHEGGIPGFTSLNSWFPKQHVYVIVLDNMNSSRIYKIGKNLAAIVFGKKYKTPKPFKKISLSTKELKKFVGTYQINPKLFMYVTQKGDQLKAQLTGQPAYPIYPESNTHFFLKIRHAEIYFKTNDQGKVTGADLHQGGRKLMAKRVNPDKAPKPTSELKAITLPADALQKFVGVYKLKIGAKITISLKDNQLTARVAGQRAFSIYPESKTEFFLKAVDAQVSFKINSKDEVTGLIWHQGGRDIPGKKVK
jgi:CubicO group peptidase (beta-lactamase class C family)